MFYNFNHIVFALLAVVFSFCGCEKVIVIEGEPAVEGIQGNPDKDVYYTALSYPEGYDWIGDPSGGEVEISLLLLRNSDLLLSLNANSLNQVSAQADMHYLFGEDLYCLWSDGEKCSVKKNGDYCCRWQSEERLCDLLVSNGEIFTLGIRGGNELIFRQNGSILLQEENAELTDGLFEDNGEVCFAFARLLESNDNTVARQYFLAHGPERTQIIPPMEASRLYSVTRQDGVLHTLGQIAGKKQLIAVKGPNAYVISYSQYQDLRGAQLVSCDGKILIHAQVKTASVWRDIWWEGTKTFHITEPGLQLLTSPSSSLKFGCLSSIGARTGPLTLFDGNNSCKLDSRYTFFSSNAALFTTKGAIIGVNDSAKNFRPVIINGADTLRYTFNGYFTRISLP